MDRNVLDTMERKVIHGLEYFRVGARELHGFKVNQQVERLGKVGGICSFWQSPAMADTYAKIMWDSPMAIDFVHIDQLKAV